MVTKLWFAGLYEPYKPLRGGISNAVQKNVDGWVGFLLTMDVLIPPIEGYYSSSVHLQRNPVRFMTSCKVCLTFWHNLAVLMVTSLNYESCQCWLITEAYVSYQCRQLPYLIVMRPVWMLIYTNP